MEKASVFPLWNYFCNSVHETDYRVKFPLKKNPRIPQHIWNFKGKKTSIFFILNKISEKKLDFFSASDYNYCLKKKYEPSFWHDSEKKGCLAVPAWQEKKQ